MSGNEPSLDAMLLPNALDIFQAGFDRIGRIERRTTASALLETYDPTAFIQHLSNRR